jgi:hypothetical protein
MGAGGGDNVTIAVATNINGANAQIDISPTGTGHVHIKPTGVNSVEIAPTFVGEMDNITIGAITPKAGTFTTITGQTGVLRGTGNNLLLQSNTFNTTWSATQSSVSGSQPDPFGGSTAWTITGDGTSNPHNIAQNIAFSSGLTYTYSAYFKKNTNNFVQISFGAAVGTQFVNFNLDAGTVGTTSASTTGAISSVGNGWYRCSMTATATSSSTTGCIVYLVTSSSAARGEVNTLTTSIFIWGAQLEIGNIANDYIPTTTTAVYGTPTLSFSGVSSIGLLSNGALYLEPAGTGAIQADATTSTTAGGNARGANAVDWQMNRSSAAQVASSQYSVIGGGTANTSNGFNTTVAGGNGNTASGSYGFVGGGLACTATRDYSSSMGGQANTATGYYNFIGGGFTNSGTSNAAVTTQSGTMNATTAVTLSGSNANIRVGQYITGTSIAGDTYVAAISGTSLTLSKNASGSSTSTLSFFTPHGVVVGGGNNQATGSYSFIGGGGDAGTAANRNTASGDWSAILGGRAGTTRGITGFQAFPACSIPIASGAGFSQSGLLVLGRQTTDATATALASDANTVGATNQVILPNNSAYFFRGEVISGVTGGGDTKGWTIEGVIKRGANAASTALVGVPTVTSTYADLGAATWDIAVTADTTNGGIRVTFTGQLATTIRTVCQIRTTEMTY